MLSSQKELEELSEWIQLDYFKRSSPLSSGLTWAARLAWGIGILLGVILVALPFAGWQQPLLLYQARPVSTAHLPFNHACASCHTEPLETGLRLCLFDDSVRSVGDQTCLKCHDGPIHHAQQLSTPSCAGCHREHQGPGELARVPAEHCTACHANLRTRSKESSFAKHITAFEGNHPEFGQWRGRAMRDSGTIRFNHKVHLKNGLVGIDRKPVTLDCSACHRPDLAGRYMEPIRYQVHCAGCHPLYAQMLGEWTEPQIQKRSQRFREEPLPHPRAGETAVQVRDALRGRLLSFTQEPGVLKSHESSEPDRSIPGRRRALPVLATELEWVNHQLNEIEPVLFDAGGGCGYCHRETTQPKRRPNGLPDYAPPNISERWFPHGQFSHHSHRALRCLSCHEKAPESVATSDVLLPTKQACQKCHSTSGGTRTDCVECHLYHDRSRSRGLNGTLKIEDLYHARN